MRQAFGVLAATLWYYCTPALMLARWVYLPGQWSRHIARNGTSLERISPPGLAGGATGSLLMNQLLALLLETGSLVLRRPRRAASTTYHWNSRHGRADLHDPPPPSTSERRRLGTAARTRLRTAGQKRST